MSKPTEYHFGGNRLGKSRLMAAARDAALERGQAVAVCNLVNGEVHTCIVKPFRRPEPPSLNPSERESKL